MEESGGEKDVAEFLVMSLVLAFVVVVAAAAGKHKVHCVWMAMEDLVCGCFEGGKVVVADGIEEALMRTQRKVVRCF